MGSIFEGMDEKCHVCERWTYDFYFVYDLDMCDDCAKEAGYELEYSERWVWVKKK